MERTKRRFWLEIIKIRSPRDADGMVKDVIHVLKSASAIGDGKAVRVFSNAVGDIAVHISWESGQATPEGSSMGLQLAAALSEYGLINHTMWIEEV